MYFFKNNIPKLIVAANTTYSFGYVECREKTGIGTSTRTPLDVAPSASRNASWSPTRQSTYANCFALVLLLVSLVFFLSFLSFFPFFVYKIILQRIVCSFFYRKHEIFFCTNLFPFTWLLLSYRVTVRDEDVGTKPKALQRCNVSVCLGIL